MKSFITLTSLAVLAALALVGCRPDNSPASTSPPTTNAGSGSTNGLATNSLPDVHTNMAANDP